MHRVRLATPADAETLARLRWEFRAVLNEPVESEDAFVRRCTAWMAERLRPGSSWRCWLAESDGRVAGHLWLCLIEKIPNPAPELEQHAYVTNVYVRPDARDHGFGGSLMTAAMDYCRDQHVDSVILWPTSRSRSLYARHGFEPPADMMEAILDDARELH